MSTNKTYCTKPFLYDLITNYKDGHNHESNNQLNAITAPSDSTLLVKFSTSKKAELFNACDILLVAKKINENSDKSTITNIHMIYSTIKVDKVHHYSLVE